jgi:hypothetical protein
MNLSLIQYFSGVLPPIGSQVPAVEYRAIVVHRETLALAGHQPSKMHPAPVKTETRA